MDDFDLSEWLSDSSPQAVGVTVSVERVENETEVLPVQPSLSVAGVRILSYLEQVYWESGLLPTPENVAEELSISISTVRNTFKNETLQQQLACRGIDPVGLVFPGKQIVQSKALSPKQILCANMMLNLHDKRSEREKLAELQVSSQQYHAWLRQPQFIEFMRKRGEALFQSSDFKAYKSLVRNVEAGDNKSLELFFRMRGIYNPSVDININIDIVLQQVVEVIARHVTDPVVLNNIANELEHIIDAEEVA